MLWKGRTSLQGRMTGCLRWPGPLQTWTLPMKLTEHILVMLPNTDLWIKKVGWDKNTRKIQV
ncbi:MAG: hypothetical protein ACI815_001063 [Psychroserpens sp.]|jgi:hypothetical protein